MEIRNRREIKSLQHLRKSDVTTIRIGLNAAFKPNFDTLIEQEADTILLTITATLRHLCQLAPEDFDEFLIQHGETLKQGIYEAQNALSHCPIDTPTYDRVQFYMTARAMIIQAIMQVLKTIVSENQNLPPNPPPPPPAAPAATLPRMHIPVPIPEEEAPKTLRTGEIPPLLRHKLIKLDPQKIDEDYLKLQEVLHALKQAKAANRAFEIKYPLHYKYLHPELYRDFYQVEALTIDDPSVTSDPFKRNAEILREIHAISGPIRR